MSKITRRTVCAGLVAVPAVAAVGIRPSTAFWAVQETTAAVASPDVIGRVIEIVSQHEKLSAEVLLSPLRTREAVTARRKALYLSFRLSGKSLPEIGRRFGGRDHTTVLHAVRVMESRAIAEPSFRMVLTNLARHVDPLAETLLEQSENRLARVM